MDDIKYKNEIEEPEEEEPEEESVKFFDAKQKELVTSVVDYNLETLANLVAQGTIDLSPKYQRRFRWDEKKQSKLIESFLMNVPVPPIFLNEDEYGKYSIIDGKQRLSAVREFLRGRLVLQGLKVFSDINGKSIDTLPISLKSSLQTRANLRAVIILKQSDKNIKFEVFRRLNMEGVALNAQEIRNSVYPGDFNNLILELSEIKQFHKLLGIKDKEKSKTYQTMRDVEFVLRYFTFRDNWDSISGGIKTNMDNFMEGSHKFSIEQINEMRADFLNTLDVVKTCFGENTFKRYIPEKKQWRRLIIASLFDAQMFACHGLDCSFVYDRKEKIIEGYKALFLDPEFRKAVDAATNTPTYFERRISMVKHVITNAGIQ